LDIACAAEKVVARLRSEGGRIVSKAEALTTALVETLDREFLTEFYDYVLVENQPSRKNPSMKGIQVAIHTYFATIRIHTPTVGRIRLVSATQKLLVSVLDSEREGNLEILGTLEKKNDEKKKTAGVLYRERKMESIELCIKCIRAELGEGAGAALEQLGAAKKKDDLSDAFLQAMWWKKTLSEPPKRKLRNAAAPK
jgi:hypothetical protein